MRTIALSRRRQALAAWQDGASIPDAARAANVSTHSVRRWIAHWQATGSIDP